MMDEAGERASEIATLRAESERLTADLLSTVKMVANQAHEIKRLRAALEPFVRAEASIALRRRPMSHYRCL
jgi:hypothetical protein